MDEATFDARYGALFADLRRVCAALGHADDADDIAQDVLVYGRANLRKLRDDSRLVAWLHRITVRRASRGRRLLWLQAHTAPSDIAAQFNDLDLMVDEQAAIRQLTPRQRQYVSLVYVVGYDQEEVAEMLGVSRGTVARTLWESRRKLAHALAEYRQGDGGAS